MRLIFILILALLTGCTPQTQQKIQEDYATVVAKLATTSIADLNAAAASAAAHNDTLAVACYPALANWVITLQQAHGQANPLMGAFSSFQEARNAYKEFNGAGGGLAAVPTSVKIGCAALYLDAKNDFVGFILLLTQIASGTWKPPVFLP